MSKIIKKCISVLVSATIILTLLPVAYAADSNVICSAVLSSSTPTVTNCKVAMGSKEDITSYSWFGTKGWKLETTATSGGGYSTKSAYLYIDVDDSVYSMPNMSDTVILSVKYLDKGDNKFSVGYDSYDGAETYGGHVFTDDPLMPRWKTAEFVLRKPRFNNKLKGYDIKLAVYSGYLGHGEKEIVISSVTLTKGVDNPIDINISSEVVGNVFYNAQKPQFKTHFRNISSEDENFEITYTIKNKYTEEMVFEDSESLYIPSGGTYEVSFAPEVNYGIYDVEISATTDSGLVSSAKSEFSLVSSNLFGEGISDSYGVATHLYSQYDLSGEEALPMMARAGFGLVRDSAAWSGIETAKGVYSLPQKLKTFVSKAKEVGVEPLIIIGGGACKSLYPDLKPYSREDLRASNPDAADEGELKFREYLDVMYDYIYNSVLLLGDSVKYYEIGNEYNLGVKNPYFPEDGVQNRAADYVRILKAAYEAIKAANPEAVVVGGVLAETGDKIPSSYIKEMYSLGAGAWMDCLSVHFYKHGYVPGETGYKAMEELKEVDDIITSYADEYGDKELWVTEYGWREFEGYMTELEQASRLLKSRVFFARDSLPDKAFWYMFDGRLAASLDNRYQDYAMVKSYTDNYNTGIVKGGAKPAYLTTANYSKLMGNTVFKEDKSSGNKQEYLFYDNKNNVDISVIWSLSGSETFTFSESDYETLTTVDMYGNVSMLDATDGVYTVTVGSTPVYIMPKIETEKLTLVEDNYSKIRFKGVIPTEKPTNIALALLKPGKTMADFKANPITSSEYIGQITTDSEGRYDELIRLSGDNGTYTLLYGIGGGELKQLEIKWYQTPYDTELVITQNGVLVDSVLEFNPKENFGMNIKVNNARALSGKCVLVTAFYNGNTLVDCKVMDGVIESSEFVKNFANKEPLTLSDGAQIDKIKLLMLDSFDKLVPLASVKTIE